MNQQGQNKEMDQTSKCHLHWRSAHYSGDARPSVIKIVTFKGDHLIGVGLGQDTVRIPFLKPKWVHKTGCAVSALFA